MYEHEQKRTYSVMLIQVVIYVPLLIGLIILYPWLVGKYKIKYSQQNEDIDNEREDEKTGLIPDTPYCKNQ